MRLWYVALGSVALAFAMALTVAGGGCNKTGTATQPAGAVCSGASTEDFDCDGVPDITDNCLDLYNPSQSDEDGDGIGDLCEILPCGDGICDPAAGECDVFDYCLKDCTQSLCFGLPAGETCGNGICEPLAGECSKTDPCIQDCPDPDLFCFPQTCGDGICQPWEDNPKEQVSFCFFDCICHIDKSVEDECHSTADCIGQPGTICEPEGAPIVGPGSEVPDFSQDACLCTTCGNGFLDGAEGCDPSAGFDVGLRPCSDAGYDYCDGFTCQCANFEHCDNGIDDDGDGLVDCADPDCLIVEEGGGQPFEICSDCTDNDGDGLNNCDDPDCAGDPACAPPPEAGCGNGSFDPPAEECDDTAGPPSETGAACDSTLCVDPGQPGECTCQSS